MVIYMIMEERIAAYIHSLDKEPIDIIKKIEQEALLDRVPIIKKPTQGLLRFLISSHKPEKVLEVGTGVGFSAVLMSECLPGHSSITTIEKVPKRIQKAKENFLNWKKRDQITLLEGEASFLLQELADKKKERFDFIFMDAAKGQYMNFLPPVLKLLTKGGLLVSDNVLQGGDVLESRYAVTRRNRTIHFRMREYLYQLTHTSMLETIVLPIGDGVTLSTKL